MSSVRRAAALWTLAALVAPFAGGAALSVHVGGLLRSHHAGHDDHDHGSDASDDHDADLTEHAGEFQHVWHGHRHDRGAPEHSHPSVFASLLIALGPAAPRVIPSHGSHVIELAGDAGRPPGPVLPPGYGLAAAGAVAPADPPAILRV